MTAGRPPQRPSEALCHTLGVVRTPAKGSQAVHGHPVAITGTPRHVEGTQ